MCLNNGLFMSKSYKSIISPKLKEHLGENEKANNNNTVSILLFMLPQSPKCSYYRVFSLMFRKLFYPHWVKVQQSNLNLSILALITLHNYYNTSTKTFPDRQKPSVIAIF